MSESTPDRVGRPIRRTSTRTKAGVSESSAGQAGQKDYHQKLLLRRVFRSFGWGTRTNVLLADVSDNHRELVPRSYTDIDVLAIGIAPDFRFLYTVGYCTTSRATSERVFWLRGVRDEFGNAEAVFVATTIPASARALCARNAIATLNEEELKEYAETSERPLSPERRAFELRLEPGVELYTTALRTLGKRFDPLVAYRDYIHLQLGHARNLQVAITTLRLAHGEWRATDPRHLAFVLDVTGLYALALVDASRNIRRTGRTNLHRALASYVGGGAALRDKQQLTELVGELLSELAKSGVQVDAAIRDAIRPLPAYVADVEILANVILDSPLVVTRLPWYLETLQLGATLRMDDIAGALEEAGEDPKLMERTFRLIREVLSFLVVQAGLGKEFLSEFDRLLAPARASRVGHKQLGLPLTR